MQPLLLNHSKYSFLVKRLYLRSPKLLNHGKYSFLVKRLCLRSPSCLIMVDILFNEVFLFA